MGIDLVKRGRIKNSNKRNTRSTNLYVHLLIKLFRFLARRTESGFSKTVLRRLISSRTNRPPISISKIAQLLKGQAKTAVVVSTVTDDIRTTGLDTPKMTIAALRFTETARAKIVKAGGKCLTLDQLIMATPTGTNTLLLRASQDRDAKKHFGRAPGLPGSHTKPYVRSKGRKFEKVKHSLRAIWN